MEIKRLTLPVILFSISISADTIQYKLEIE
jgi:hypothetical protein